MAPAELLPALAIQAFAGLRTSELLRLDWGELDQSREDSSRFQQRKPRPQSAVDSYRTKFGGMVEAVREHDWSPVGKGLPGLSRRH
jgi:hypothetical protein